MKAPEGFRLPNPIDFETHPPPGLPKYLKHQVYDKPEVFAKVDNHAIQVAEYQHPTFRDLMWDLLYRYKLDELERARVIFRWMTAKDMQNIYFEHVPPNSPEDVLMSFSTNRGTFSRMYEVMCNYSEIHCVTVSGYAKGVDYLPGDKFSGLPPNHSWNVIYIRGSWQLIDVHWAARYLSSGKNVPENVVYEYDDFYFMMEPQQAVYSHFPEDQRWQLLPVPLTLSQFENLPLTKSQFFKCAIDFLQQHHGVVRTQDGCLRMSLGFWRPGGFTYKLQYLVTSFNNTELDSLTAYPSELMDQVPNLNVDLKCFVLQETTKDHLNFFFRLPASGIYYLTIYAQELSGLTVGRESTFRAACEYKIICDSPARDAQPYPICHDANWGPAWSHVHHYALEPSHSEGVISISNELGSSVNSNGHHTPLPKTVDIRFQKHRPEVNLLAKLHRNGVSDDFLDQYQRVTETVRETLFHVTLPEPGEYGLEVYANEPAEGDTYTHMCQYLIHYEHPSGWKSTPRLTVAGADAGPSPEAQQFRHSIGRTSNGNANSIRNGNATKYPTSNEPLLSGSLREMYNYELDAPPIGNLPKLYAHSQYENANQPAFNRLNNYSLNNKDDNTSKHLPYGYIPSKNSHLTMNNDRDHKYYTSALSPPTGSSNDQLSNLSQDFSNIKMKQDSSLKNTRIESNSEGLYGYNSITSDSSTTNPLKNQPLYSPSIVGQNHVGNGMQQKFSTSTSSPIKYQNSVRFEPGSSSYVSSNGSNTNVGYVSPPGSSNSSSLPYYKQQQYDQVTSTSGRPNQPSSNHFYKPDQSTANWSSGPIQRVPPKEFAPSPLSMDTLEDKPRPQEIPTTTEMSAAPYQSFEVFRRIDEHAVSISQQQQDNFNQLIWQLIYARNITDELEKVRVIFLWLCTKDLHKMNFDYVKPDSPEEILMGIRTGKSTYAQIFYTLCRYAGLHCKLLIGYAKGAEYAPGMHFSGRQGQHSWNAVLIDKVWRLIDCHWAARRLIGKRPSPDNVRYGLDMFYFLANPSQLIYTHFPHDPDWQLLRHPITLKEFENLAPVKSAFFKYNLDLVTHRNAVIICSDPEVRIVIAFPSGAENYLSFTFGLSFDNQEGSEEYRGIPLTRYGRQETVIHEHTSVFYIRPPRPGAYKLLIYAKQQHQPHQNGQKEGLGIVSMISDDTSSENLFGAVCEYRLVANFGSNRSLPPFPPCQSSSYGPNELAKNYRITPQRVDCTLRAVRGSLEIRFGLSALPGRPPPRLMAKLKCTLVAESALSKSLLQRNINGNTEAVFAIFLPEAGEYGLEVYANDPVKDENSFFVVWQYIIISDCDSPVRGLPTIAPTYLGPVSRFDSMGLKALSHPDPFIQANTGELCIQFARHPDKPLRIMAQLIHCSHDVSEDCSQQILQQTRGPHIYFVVRFPHPGFFKFQIYALPYTEPGESLPGVYNYLLEATQVNRGRNGHVMCFPQQFAQWKEGCYLHSPMDGILYPSGSNQANADTIPFRVSVPTAHAVAVVVGEDWTHLSQVSDCWVGQVCLKPYWGIENQLALCAKYDVNDGNYGTLLEYRLAKR
ncbi:Hillarin [Schistosoma japonicum]|nr:Hillarin [Schistosoma japonicum]